MTSPSWHITIVNYKTAELAARAARSARKAMPGARIVVVDSASGDQCKDLLAHESSIEFLGLTENRGYGAALNAGVRNSNADYLLLLNADLELEADTVSQLQSRLDNLPTLGVVAPRLRSSDGMVQPSCRRFPTHGSLFFSRGSPLGWLRAPTNRSYRVPEPSAFTLTDVVAGACWAVRRNVWEELQGMDEEFFLYAEDTDFCLRAKRAGWLVGYDPTVTVTHRWGASTSQTRRHSHRLHAESLSRYFRKHYPRRRWANVLVSCLLRAHARLRA